MSDFESSLGHRSSCDQCRIYVIAGKIKIEVVLIIGIAGACRKEELTKLLLENVKDKGSDFNIKIPNTKTKISREVFVTSGGIQGVNIVGLIRKYLALRPQHIDHGRFFVRYGKGSCVKQPVGINTFGSMPKTIAIYLNLSHPEECTGHCFRRFSISILADSGPDLLTAKRHGSWKSNTIAKGYIDTSKENKKKVAMNILVEDEVSTSNCYMNNSTLEISNNNTG